MPEVRVHGAVAGVTAVEPRRASFGGRKMSAYLGLLRGLCDRAGYSGSVIADAARRALRDAPGPLDALRADWDRTLDLGVYHRPIYLAEAFACWWTYSRRYVHGLADPRRGPPGTGRSIAAHIAPRGPVVDVGCGIAFSTVGLAELWPTVTVYGTQLDSPQRRVAAELAAALRRRVSVVPALAEPCDVVFASEYFEHFQEPVAHLRELLAAGQPRVLLAASTFGQPAIGHYPRYRVDGRTLGGREAAQAWRAEMRAHGYQSIPTRMWNRRPEYWRRG